jgi:flavorubredoxin
MPNIVIIYDSMTGNTELMAKAVDQGACGIEDVTADVHKLGTKFPISSLEKAAAIVVGSPTVYGGATEGVAFFFNNLGYLKRANLVDTGNMKGAAFASYGWDGGWVVGRIELELKALGVKIVAPAVSAVDQGGVMGVKIHRDDLEKCRELGRAVAEAITSH